MASIARDCRDTAAEAEALAQRITSAAPGAPVARLQLFDAMQRVLYNQLLRQELVVNVHVRADIRDAARACQNRLDELRGRMERDPSIYAALAAIDASALPADSRRYVQLTLAAYQRNGAALDEPSRRRLAELDSELSRLGQEFERHIAEDEEYVELTRDQLAGMPDDWLSAHAAQGDTVRVSVSGGDYSILMTYLDSEKAREALYRARGARATGKNDVVLDRLLRLRHEKARLLGFESWADHVTAGATLGSAAEVDRFLRDIVAVTEERVQRDYQLLLDEKRRKEPDAVAVMPHDWRYYTNKVRQDRLDLDSREISRYFEYQHVEAGLLALATRLFGLEFHAVKVRAWHPSVKAYEVREQGVVLGRLYVDAYSRDGKFRHAAHFPIRPGVEGVQRPEGALVYNVSAPTDAPVFLDHAQVVLLFHEFGHALHHIVRGRQQWTEFALGPVERDLGEAFAQLFEEWAWRPEALAYVARHHDTGEPIPDRLVARLNQTRRSGMGITIREHVTLSHLALELHRREPGTVEPTALETELRGRLLPFPVVPGLKFHLTFWHLNSYSAMYYSYALSAIVAMDMFRPFAEHGVLDPGWARRLLDEVLRPGGRAPARVLVQRFLGRPIDTRILESWLHDTH